MNFDFAKYVDHRVVHIIAKKRIKKGTPSSCYRRRAQNVFQDKVPPDDEGAEFANGYVGVQVS